MNCPSLRHLFAAYPVSWCCIIVIWVLCLIPLPETPLSEVRFFDKWTHLVFYGGLCTVIWTEYGRCHAAIGWRRALCGAIVAPLIMGALIEVAQAYCTFGIRNGDFIDWIADAVGVALGQATGIPLAHWLARRNKD